MPIAYYAYCLICLLLILPNMPNMPIMPIMPNMPIITTPPEQKIKGSTQPAIVCEQHAPLFILHRAPADKLVPQPPLFEREKTETIIPGARNSHAAHR